MRERLCPGRAVTVNFGTLVPPVVLLVVPGVEEDSFI